MTTSQDDTAHRLRSVSGLVGSVSTAYTAAHGHPLDHDGLVGAETGRRRWSVSLRVALLAGTVLLLLAGAIVTTSIARTSAEPVPLGSADPASRAAEAPGVDAAGNDVGGASGSVGVTDALTGPDDPAAGTTVLVHVVGQVRAAGVIEIPEGSRVVDAIAGAGGMTPEADAAAVNLARTVVDGEQIYVPAPGEVPPMAPGPPGGGGDGGAGGGADGAPQAPVDVNAATAEQLDVLPGIGPALADRIVTWRTKNGRFTSVDDLLDVSGIGPAVLEKIRPLVTV